MCRSLLLSNQSLRGTVPEQLYALSSLEKLEFWGNRFLGATISTRIGRLSRLTFLDVDANSGLSGTLPTQLGLLTALSEEVWIDETSLSGVCLGGLVFFFSHSQSLACSTDYSISIGTLDAVALALYV